MTVVRFDTFLTDIRAGRILTDTEFELLSYDKEGNIVSVQYNGVYVGPQIGMNPIPILGLPDLEVNLGSP